MVWQLICNLIILSSRTHYSLFIALLSSQVCCSWALRTTEHAFLLGKSYGGQEWSRGGFCSRRWSSWMLVAGTAASNLHTAGLGNANGLAKEELGCFQWAINLLQNEAFACVYGWGVFPKWEIQFASGEHGSAPQTASEEGNLHQLSKSVLCTKLSGFWVFVFSFLPLNQPAAEWRMPGNK